MKKQAKKKKDNFLIAVFKNVKLSSLILLVIALCANAYAWFIYATKASTGIEAYVTSWNITFQAGEDDSTTNIKIDIDEIYPGMDTWTREIDVVNKGETAARLEYSIGKMTVLGTNYIVGENITQEEMDNKIQVFPFKIEIIADQGNIEEINGKGKFTIKVSWIFENGNDELDTKWGQDAYKFKNDNPDESCLHIDLLLKAVQVAETTT